MLAKKLQFETILCRVVLPSNTQYNFPPFTAFIKNTQHCDDGLKEAFSSFQKWRVAIFMNWLPPGKSQL
jgi:hypothetical protein